MRVLQEEDARYANKKIFQARPAEPLYTEDDAREVLKQFKMCAKKKPWNCQAV